MKGPTICRLSLGKARRTSKPSPKSRTRGTTTSSSASHDLLLPRIGSAKGIQLITNPRFSYSPFELRSSAATEAVKLRRSAPANKNRCMMLIPCSRFIDDVLHVEALLFRRRCDVLEPPIEFG